MRTSTVLALVAPLVAGAVQATEPGFWGGGPGYWADPWSAYPGPGPGGGPGFGPPYGPERPAYGFGYPRLRRRAAWVWSRLRLGPWA